MKKDSLYIAAQQIEYVYDKLDTNALNIITKDGYFCIQRGVAIDPKDDPLYNKPHIELDSQMNGDYFDLREVIFFSKEIHIIPESIFNEKYNCIIIGVPDGVDKKIIDFFVNYLFLGDIVKYTEDIDPILHIKQTSFPELLDKEVEMTEELKKKLEKVKEEVAAKRRKLYGTSDGE